MKKITTKQLDVILQLRIGVVVTNHHLDQKRGVQVLTFEYRVEGKDVQCHRTISGPNDTTRTELFLITADGQIRSV